MRGLIYIVPYKIPSLAYSTAGVMNLVQMSRSLRDFLSGEFMNSFGKFDRSQTNQIDPTDQSDRTD